MDFYATFGYQWLEGSIRKDLDSAGRGVWADILSLASISRRVGFLERSQGIPYTDEELANKFQIPLELLKHTIVVCVQEGRLTRDDTGTLFITNWNKYQKIPLGTPASTKVIKPEKHQYSQEERDGMLRRAVNTNPDTAREVLVSDFGDSILEKSGEVHGTGEVRK